MVNAMSPFTFQFLTSGNFVAGNKASQIINRAYMPIATNEIGSNKISNGVGITFIF